MDLAELGLSVRSDGFVVADRRMDKFDRTTRKTERGLKPLIKSLRGLAAVMGVTFTAAAFTREINEAQKRTRAFEQTTRQMVGLVGVSERQVAGFGESIGGLAVETGIASQALADAMFFVTSAGYRGAEAMDVLERSAKAAATGLGETKDIADLVTSAVNAYGPEVLDASRATDVLVAAVREGKLEAQTLGPAMASVISTASALGASFDDVAGTMAVFSRTGMDAGRSSVAIEAFFSTLLGTSKEGEEALTDMGLSLEGLRAVVQEQGTIAAMRLLNDTFDGQLDKLRMVVPNVRAFRGVMNALAQDSATVDGVLRGVSESTGALDEAFKATESRTRKLAQEQERYNAALEKLGEVIPDIATSWTTLKANVAEFVAENRHFIAALNDNAKYMLASPIGGLTAAYVDYRNVSKEIADQKLYKSFQKASQVIDDMIPGTKQLGKELATVPPPLGRAAANADDLATSAKKAAVSLEDLLVPAESLERLDFSKIVKDFWRLEDQLDPAAATLRTLRAQLETLHNAWDAKLIRTKQRYADLRDEIFKTLVEIDTTTRKDVLPSLEELRKKADPLAKAYERGLERMRDGIGDFFQKLIVDGKASFDDLLDLFKKMIAEMIATAAAKKIMITVGAIGGSAAANAGSGDGSVGGLAGITGTQLAGAAVSGYAGGWAGGAVGEGLLGKEAESNVGATTGAAVGAIIGSVIPIIGTYLGAFLGGAIGGFLDVAFGGDGMKRASLGVQTNAAWTPDTTDPDRVPAQVRAESGLLLTAYARRVGDEGKELAENMLKVFSASDAALTGLFESLGVTVDLAGQTLKGINSDAQSDNAISEGFFGSAAMNGIDQADLKGAPDAFVEAWVDRVNELTGAAIDIEPFRKLQKEGELLADVILRATQNFRPINDLLTAIGSTAFDLSVEGMAAADSLVQAAGGVQNFQATTAEYYRLFFSQEEQRAAVTDKLRGVFSSLNVEMPATLQGFRDLVKGLDLTTAEGQSTFATLMQVAPAFHEVATAANAAEEAVSQTMERLLEERAKLEAEMLRAQGKTEEYEDALRALATEGMTEAEKAAYSYNERLKQQVADLDQASREQQDILDAAAKAQQSAAQERYRLESQLLRLQGDTAALRERELELLDPANRSLQKMIWALEDAAALDPSANTGSGDPIADMLGLDPSMAWTADQIAQYKALRDQMNDSNSEVLDERLRLEGDLARVMGDTDKLRQMELANLDASNRALQEQIWAIEDANKAAKEFERTWGRVTEALLEEARALRQEVSGGAVNLAAAQTQFAVLTAQARAGNADAAARLPAISRSVIDVARMQAESSVEFRRIAARMATSLEATADIAPGNSDIGQSIKETGKATVSELEEIKTENRELKETVQQLTITINKLYRIWDDVTQGGTTVRTEETT